MAIGRTFQESMQKALRGLEIGTSGFDPVASENNREIINSVKRNLVEPGPNRIWHLADAFRLEITLEEIYAITKIDRWFLCEIQDLIFEERQLFGKTIEAIDESLLYQLKRKGFSDYRICLLYTSPSPRD